MCKGGPGSRRIERSLFSAADGRCRRIAAVRDRVRGRLKWADSAPTEVASGRTGVWPKALIPLRARNRLHHSWHAFVRALLDCREGRTPRLQRLSGKARMQHGGRKSQDRAVKKTGRLTEEAENDRGEKEECAPEAFRPRRRSCSTRRAATDLYQRGDDPSMACARPVPPGRRREREPRGYASRWACRSPARDQTKLTSVPPCVSDESENEDVE
jgi:hypothetical protein